METHQLIEKKSTAHPTHLRGQFDGIESDPGRFDTPAEATADGLGYENAWMPTVKIQQWAGLKFGKTSGEITVMTITAKGKNFYLSDDLKEAIKRRLGEMERFLNGVSHLDAVLTRMGHQFRVRVDVDSAEGHFEATITNNELLRGVELAVRKIRYQTGRIYG
jgi:ribosomal subunit interface protein